MGSGSGRCKNLLVRVRGCSAVHQRCLWGGRSSAHVRAACLRDVETFWSKQKVHTNSYAIVRDCFDTNSETKQFEIQPGMLTAFATQCITSLQLQNKMKVTCSHFSFSKQRLLGKRKHWPLHSYAYKLYIYLTSYLSGEGKV